MRVSLLVAALSGLGTAASSEVLWQEGCWRRVYDEAHLAAHPRQQVKEIAIRLVGDPSGGVGLGFMDIFARVRPIEGHKYYRNFRDGQAGISRLQCFVQRPEVMGQLAEPVTSCAHINVCALDEWVRITTLDEGQAVIRDSSYDDTRGHMIFIGDDDEVAIGKEVDCGGEGPCRQWDKPVHYRMEAADPAFCAAIFDHVRPNEGCDG